MKSPAVLALATLVLVSDPHTVQPRSREEENDEESRGSGTGDAPARPFLPVLPICDVRCGQRRMPYNQ